MQFTLEKPKNFSFSACLQFLNRGYDECLYAVDATAVRRLIRLKSGLAFLAVSDNKQSQKLCISLEKIDQNTEISEQDIRQSKDYICDWFDLERDLSDFYQLLKQHSPTRDFPQKYCGLRLMGIVDLFEALCWCVIGQQINLTFAHKIKTRLVHRYGDKLSRNKQEYYAFPSPQVLLKAKREDLVAMQFSKQKINYLLNISQAFCDNVLDKKQLLQHDKASQMAQLTAIKGIGPWTANYVCMKSLRDMTCIAYGDTGLSSALHQHFATVKKPDKNTIDTLFQPFAGWESYLNFYLWRSLSE